MNTINLDPGEEVEITGTNLILPDIARNKIVVRSKVKPGVPPPPDPDPEPIPPPSGENRIANGRLEDAQGNASLDWWFQEPGQVWFNTHSPRPGCVGHFIQGDRDFPPPAGGNVWRGGNPSSATIETFTAADLPQHSEVYLSWSCAHHITTGSAVWQLEGRQLPAADFSDLGEFSIVAGVPGTKVCKVVSAPKIVVPAGGFRQYRLRAAVTLASDGDGVIFGDVKLTVK